MDRLNLNLALDLAITLLSTAFIWIVFILTYSYIIGSKNGAGSDIEAFFYGIYLLPSVMVITFNLFLIFNRSWKKQKIIFFSIDIVLIFFMLITIQWPIMALKYIINL